VHHAEKGAHTGCVSAQMLVDAGAALTIVGHSERRDAQREQGAAVETVLAQLDGSLPEQSATGVELAVAYEPVWAIGTGKIPTTAEIAEMHAAIRDRLAGSYGPAGETVRILYGGSVKASNAREIFAVADVDGALVGGASLRAADFMPIVAAASVDR
jgi:triosephosphate isomerase